MNAWKRNTKKTYYQMEQNRKHETINQTSSATPGHNAQSTSTQRQRGCPTRLRYRTAEVEVQWID